MPKIYRVMKETDGKPTIGASATGLGVRVNKDIHPDDTGRVHPETGGMSVSPSLKDLPIQLIPRRLRHLVPRAAGSNSHRVWKMGEGPFAPAEVAPNLELRPDPLKTRHGFIEPSRIVSIDDFQTSLAATQDEWVIEEGA
jgi:hypothetical protein